jgi:inner membrane protein
MSSFMAHSWTGFITYAATRPWQLAQRSPVAMVSWWRPLALILLASAPDVDYLFPGLRITSGHQTLRTTHSIAFVLLIASGAIGCAWLFGKRGHHWKILSWQILIASYSHLFLDLCTGVMPLPLLYPLSNATFRLPFGILPSAGRIQLHNYFFYRNLLIEIGVLLPLSISLLLLLPPVTRSQWRLPLAFTGFVISAGFMAWAFSLSR